MIETPMTIQPVRRRHKRAIAAAAAPAVSGRAYSYTRASTEMQVNDGATLEVQERMLGGYATMKELRIERTFEERAVSGGKPFATRPAGSESWLLLGQATR